MAKIKLTPSMKHVLRNLREGRETLSGVHGRANQGGYFSVIQALVKRKLITVCPAALTPAGQRIAYEMDGMYDIRVSPATAQVETTNAE